MIFCLGLNVPWYDAKTLLELAHSPLCGRSGKALIALPSVSSA